jgi:hypothetical protein
VVARGSPVIGCGGLTGFMTIDGSAERRKQVKELAAAVSMQAQVTNRLWLTLITVAVVALLPESSATQKQADVSLLSFGKVDAATFHLMLFPVLIVLTIAFSAAYSQQVRAQTLAQSFLDSINSLPTGFGGMYPRELFDMLRLPTLNRVAPLAQALRGPYQFHSRATECPGWLRAASTAYYVLHKLTSMIVYFGLPGFALWRAYQRILPVQGIWWLAVTCGALAAAALVQIGIGESLYTIKIIPQIWSGGSRKSHPRVGHP